MQVVKSAAADGYTLLTATTSVLSVNPIVVIDLPYDPIKDFRPVILFSLGPTALVVGGTSSSKTVRELVAATKKPGSTLIVGTYAASYELICAWFGIATGVAITPVLYKGAAQGSIFARSETPDFIINKLHEGFRTVMASPEARAYQASRPGIYVDYTPEQIRAFVAKDVERFKKIAQAADIKPR